MAKKKYLWGQMEVYYMEDVVLTVGMVISQCLLPPTSTQSQLITPSATDMTGRRRNTRMFPNQSLSRCIMIAWMV